MVRILVEGISDVPLVREIMVRGFGLVQGTDFQIFWHRGKGRLPRDPDARPPQHESTLLGLLPAKLKAFGKADPNSPIVVLLDVDSDDCRSLRAALQSVYQATSNAPKTTLFQIAIEELESWFIADVNAVSAAFPFANVNILVAIPPDAIVGAWEKLAEALGQRPHECSGADKEDWSREISPYLQITPAYSPSMNAFIRGIERATGLKI